MVTKLSGATPQGREIVARTLRRKIVTARLQATTRSARGPADGRDGGGPDPPCGRRCASWSQGPDRGPAGSRGGGADQDARRPHGRRYIGLLLQYEGATVEDVHQRPGDAGGAGCRAARERATPEIGPGCARHSPTRRTAGRPGPDCPRARRFHQLVVQLTGCITFEAAQLVANRIIQVQADRFVAVHGRGGHHADRMATASRAHARLVDLVAAAPHRTPRISGGGIWKRRRHLMSAPGAQSVLEPARVTERGQPAAHGRERDHRVMIAAQTLHTAQTVHGLWLSGNGLCGATAGSGPCRSASVTCGPPPG